MKKATATIDNVYFGETPMGTGPHDGHSGDQYMADVKVKVGKEDRIFTKIIVSPGIPTKKELRSACETGIERCQRAIETEESDERQKARRRRTQKKIMGIAKGLEVTGSIQ